MASSFTNTLNTCCSCHSRFQASSEPKMKKRASWNHADICTTLLLWSCLECQSAETDGNSGSNNIDKHITAPGYWAKIGKCKCVCWEIPLENFLAMLLHMHSCVQCCQPDDILLWKDNSEELAWNDQDFIRFSVGCQHSELRGAAVVLKNGARVWLNIVRTWWEAAGGPHTQVEEEGAQGSSLSWGSATPEKLNQWNTQCVLSFL